MSCSRMCLSMPVRESWKIGKKNPTVLGSLLSHLATLAITHFNSVILHFGA